MNGDPNILLSDYVEAASPVHELNSTISERAARETQQSQQPRPLFNARDPQYVLQSERPVHRAVIFLAAQGLSYIEIAQQLGITPSCVQYVVKQDWAQEEILKQIHDNGGDAVAQVLSQQALPSVMKLIELRDSEKAAAEVQRKAANDLLDRIFGKPNQPVTHHQENLDEMTDAELQEVIAKSRKN
jgi:predicted transcriptional regulator